MLKPSISGVLYIFAITFIISILPAQVYAETSSGWSSNFAPVGFTYSSNISATTEYKGDLVIAGSFHVFRDSIRNIGLWDGKQWHPLGEMGSNIRCLLTHQDKLLAGGKFSTGWEQPTTGLKYWDGHVWQIFDETIEGEVNALVSFQNELIAGGRFYIDGDTKISHIARWDGKRWHALGGGIAKGGRTRVQALAVHENKLIVGGIFSSAGNLDTSHIASWDGTIWTDLGAGADDVVAALCSAGTTLYAAGKFNTMDGLSTSCIAAWDGSQWSALGDGVGNSSRKAPVVNALSYWREKLYIGGYFDSAGPLSVASIAHWDGNSWQGEVPGLYHRVASGGQGEVFSMDQYKDRLVVGGKMLMTPKVVVNNLGFWDGLSWAPLSAGEGLSNGIRSWNAWQGKMLLFCNGPVGSGGLQDHVTWEGQNWQNIGLSPCDSLSVDFKLQMVTEHQGKMMVFGDFRKKDSKTSSWHLAVWEEGWQIISPAFPYEVNSEFSLVSVGGQLMVLGSFTVEQGVKDYGVLWDGEQWNLTGLDQPIAQYTQLAVTGDRLVVPHESYKPPPLTFSLSEWDGHHWCTISEGTYCNVNALGTWQNRVVAAFNLSNANATESHALQYWDGKKWHPLPGQFSSTYARDGRIEVLADYNGSLIAAGQFKGIDGVAIANIAFLDDGQWYPLDGGVGGSVSRLLPLADGLWVNGGFSKAGIFPSKRIARWDGDLPGKISLDVLPKYEVPERPSPLGDDGQRAPARDLTSSALPFANGDFLSWNGDLPYRWDWTSRQRGDDCKISIQSLFLPEGGLRISRGDCDWGWAQLTHKFAMQSGQFYRIRARYSLTKNSSATSKTLCKMYLGDYQRNSTGYDSGSLHNGMIDKLKSGQDQWAEVILRAGEMANVGKVTFSLKGPGMDLILHEVLCDTVSISDDEIVRALIEELRVNYVPQSNKTTDWDDLELRYTNLELTEQEYEGATINALLKELDEPRVRTERSKSDVTSMSSPTQPRPILDDDKLTKEKIDAITERLMDYSIVKPGQMGWTSEGIAYLKTAFLFSSREQFDSLVTAEGLILDLRASGRGAQHHYYAEREMKKLPGWFTSATQAYGVNVNSSGRDTLLFEPSLGPALTCPVVCLIGDGCMGSGAEFAMMMQALPNVILVGRPARGGTGFTVKYSLPYGFHVHYPAAALWTLDGKLVNADHGLEPDVWVTEDGSVDPIFNAGLRVLRKMIASENEVEELQQ